MAFKTILFLCTGASLGASLRYGVSVLFKFTAFPVATVLVNVLGCFLMGVISSALNTSISEDMRAFFIVGFLGAFTTFSAYGFDIVTLFNQQQYKQLFLYLVLSNVLGVLALCTGLYIGKWYKI